MKKIILLLALPLVTLMAVEFTMTPSGLFAKTTTQPSIPTSTPSTVSEIKNSYLEPVNLPECDASNSEVQFIKSNADWSTINSISKRIFCVSPGDYTSLGNIRITASGTAEKRRYIVLNNGNNLHPGKLDKSQLANFSLDFVSASYWTLDRPSSFDNNLVNAYEFEKGSTHNIVNRMFTNNISRSVRIIDNSHYNTVQNSRLDTMTHSARVADMTAIELVPYPVNGVYAIMGTKIINNEIKNALDGIQMVSYWFNNGKELNGEGTIIDSNDIYITQDIYTDGSGNYTPTGSYAYAENAIDMKFGSSNPSNPVIITNNHFWGFRKADSTNSSLSDNGGALIGHYGLKNIMIEDNTIFNANIGIGIGDQQSYMYSIALSTIQNNLIVDCGPIPGGFIYGWSLDLTQAACTVQNNTIINGRGQLARLQWEKSDFVFQNNLYLDTPLDWSTANNSSGATIKYHPAMMDNAGDYQPVTAVSQGYTEDYTFTTNKFTNSPRIMTLKNVVKSY